MHEDLDPIAGRWYRQVDKEQVFKVVGIDEDRDVIEIQYSNGDFEEIDRDAWSDLELEASEPPEGHEDGDEDADWRESDERERDDHEWDDEDEDDDDDEDEDWDDDEDLGDSD